MEDVDISSLEFFLFSKLKLITKVLSMRGNYTESMEVSSFKNRRQISLLILSKFK